MSLSSGLHAPPAPDSSPRPSTQGSGSRASGHAGWFRWYHALIGVVALVLFALVLFVTLQPIQVLPRMTLAPGWGFTDETGATFTSENLRGKLTLYNFTYTNCQAPDCPETGAAMAAIQERLQIVETGGIPVQLLTISFDPDRDTPAVLRTWLARQGALPATWKAVTGAPDKLKNVIGAGFSAYYAQNEDGSFAFDPMYVLVDGNGIIRSRYRTATLDPEIIARDLGLVTREVANSSGAQKLAYEAAHLFLCYPD
jgi:protein SCO1/2